MLKLTTNQQWRRLSLGLTLAVIGSVTGCQGFWADTKENFNDFIYRPDPLKVVKETDSGDRRAEFLAKLNEPARQGGTAAEQEEVMSLLVKTAETDPAPTCRLQAIRTLGKFKDSRAVPALQQAYFNASAFPPDLATIIRQHSLKSMGETGDPQAARFLVRVAQADAKENDFYDRQYTTDERLAAIRAMSNFKGDPEVSALLLKLMRSEKNIAMRGRAHESLQLVTGKRFDTDAPEWESIVPAFESTAEVPGQQQPTMIQPVNALSGQKYQR